MERVNKMNIPTLEEYAQALGLDPETVRPLYEDKLVKITDGRSVSDVFGGYYELKGGFE